MYWAPNKNLLLFWVRPGCDVGVAARRGVLQSLLTHVSRATKTTLNKLGVFTVSSFHAFICARSPSLLNNLLAGRGAPGAKTAASRS